MWVFYFLGGKNVDLGISLNSSVHKILPYSPDTLIWITDDFDYRVFNTLYGSGYCRRQIRLTALAAHLAPYLVYVFCKTKDRPLPIQSNLVYFGPSLLHQRSWVINTKASTVVTTVCLPKIKDVKINRLGYMSLT